MSKRKNERNVAIALSTDELSTVYGKAGEEFLKGLSGVDYQTGVEFDRSLLSIKDYKINPDYAEQNIKQQSGYSAEVASVSRKNAEAIVEGNNPRYLRSEDHADFGKNDNVVDLVEVTDGTISSLGQMKFVGEKGLGNILDKIANGENRDGGNDLSRYLQNDELQLPTEQVDIAKKICREEVESNLKQAQKLREDGEEVLAQQHESTAERYGELEEKISDAGLTSEEARNYRLDPEVMTAKDIAKMSHRAGLEGAKYGAAIGGTISIVTNLIASISGEKELSDAAVGVVKDTSISAGVGYSSTFVASGLKAGMKQSSSAYVRTLGGTALPSLAVSACIACSSSIFSYAKGDITEAELLQNVGGVGSGMLASSMFAGVGQVVIPIPVLGGLVGGMVGYSISNVFYQGFLAAFDDAKKSREELELIRHKCAAAKKLAESYQRSLDKVFSEKLGEIQSAKVRLFSIVEDEQVGIDEFCAEINAFAEMLGKKLQFSNKNEFDRFMASNETLKI